MTYTHKYSDMEYAIEILEKDRQLLIRCLEGCPFTLYPEAHKDRNKKLKDINEAIELLKNAK